MSPAVSDNAAGQAWLASFMSQAAANNLIVDAVAFHWYGGVNLNNPAASANNFLNRVDSYHNTYNKPVWITEFAGMDFGNTISSPDLIAFNAAFLDIVVPALESRSYVQRYAWWQWGQSDNGEQADTRIIQQVNGVWTPTVIGDQYIPTYKSGETFNLNGTNYGKDTMYLKGGQVTNTGAPLRSAVGSVYALEGASTLTGTSDWGVGGGKAFILTGASLEKTGANSVSLTGVNVDNDGSLIVSAGELNIQGGSRIVGTGVTSLHAGASLSLGVAADRAGASINQPLELRGGALIANAAIDGTHSLARGRWFITTPPSRAPGCW